MKLKPFSVHLLCPWCQKGEVLADDRAKVTLSVSCPKCHRFFTADLDTQRTEQSAACKRTGRSK